VRHSPDLSTSVAPQSTSAAAEATRVAADDARDAIRGTMPMSPAYRRLHRSFVAFNTVVPLVGLVVAIVGLWGWGITRLDLGLLVGGHLLTTLGITLGFHRMLTHRGMSAPAAVRSILAILGTMAMQGPVLKWCAEHRRHHAYADRVGDPHSPHLQEGSGVRATLQGLWFAHVGWMFEPIRTDPDEWAPDLVGDPVLRVVDRLYLPIIVASLGLPAVIGWAVTGTAAGSLRAFVWGGLVRILVQLHTTWSINSICHVFGARTYDSRDRATNVWWLSVLSLGESWHNNHHAFPSSARHGLDRFQLDPTAAVIDVMERLRLVTDVRRATPRQRDRRRLPT
jgi:stearoyl-CoA desaturase (Delta-9 desaturase)